MIKENKISANRTMNNVDEIVPDETVSSGSGPTESSPLILKDDDEEQVVDSNFLFSSNSREDSF